MIQVFEYNSIFAQNKSSIEIFQVNQTCSKKEKYPSWLKVV